MADLYQLTNWTQVDEPVGGKVWCHVQAESINAGGDRYAEVRVRNRNGVDQCSLWVDDNRLREDGRTRSPWEVRANRAHGT